MVEIVFRINLSVDLSKAEEYVDVGVLASRVAYFEFTEWKIMT